MAGKMGYVDSSLSLSLSPSPSPRYLLHSADLSFLEGVARTLTSAQVGIKSEVAHSNGQAMEIFQNIEKLADTVKKVKAKVSQPLSLSLSRSLSAHNVVIPPTIINTIAGVPLFNTTE